VNLAAAAPGRQGNQKGCFPVDVFERSVFRRFEGGTSEELEDQKQVPVERSAWRRGLTKRDASREIPEERIVRERRAVDLS
jgi:hypothetical protein